VRCVARSLGKGCQQARRRPALTIGTFGALSQLGHGGQTQFPQQQRQRAASTVMLSLMRPLLLSAVRGQPEVEASMGGQVQRRRRTGGFSRLRQLKVYWFGAAAMT
jgi:hypothetical protein